MNVTKTEDRRYHSTPDITNNIITERDVMIVESLGIIIDDKITSDRNTDLLSKKSLPKLAKVAA